MESRIAKLQWLPLAANIATGGAEMQDYRQALEKLRRDAAKNRTIAGLTSDEVKRDMFAKLAEHLDALADDVERAMKKLG